MLEKLGGIYRVNEEVRRMHGIEKVLASIERIREYSDGLGT